ncbi:SDR family NAD(P)-dependent oxidoreductase [Bosea sp. (in: a-proteobacteria)]|uniref:SDR family NAD(P)-dependent oxidoreductase n=1 Tax=Bosea sp. (in: a-proteobacteria) TaxID=1871050 RepID=UPI002607CEAA|nr:SDR family NAD(P)-dependent oxidoreductase [Bosea sp. (in: a-proteobacteria)]MCO5092911.1 SDR family oxidoreductase [Bosea sp. (in: a-proteobacteria)]
MSKPFEGKTVIVFGAGACGPGWGIGKAAAVSYGRRGANVVCVDIDGEALAQTHRIIADEGGISTAIRADVSSQADVRMALDAAVSTYGGLDILHNNVGMPAAGGPEATSEETWDRVADVNVKGTFLTCKHALPLLQAAGGGSIINIGSVAGLRYLGMPQIAYATTKGSLVAMTRAIAAQYGAQNIRANVISPGITDTPLLARGASMTFRETLGITDPDEAMALRARTIPLRRFGTAWDVANLAMFLASDEASYITGTELVVDGGLTAQVQFPMT